MTSFQIRTAERYGARLLIQLSGVSGSGKTYSALQLAYGLAGGDAHKVIGIDTENRRMSLNANCMPGGAKFRVLDFYPPFSPERYIEATRACCDAGAEVIVIDSATHEYEGEGGMEDIAHRAGRGKPNWIPAKAAHKRFMNFALQAGAHIIFCTRAREKVLVQDVWSEEKRRNEKVFTSLGIQPIQEKNFSFEATVSLLMHEQGQRQEVLKCPAELQRILGRGKGYITAADGAALRAWVDGGTPVDPAVEQARGALLNAAEGGLNKLRQAWSATPKAIRAQLGDEFQETVAASAKAYDEARAGSPVIAQLNQQIAAELETTP